MKAVISNFRRGRHTVRGNQLIIKPEGIDNAEQAKSLIGKKVVWKSNANEPKEIRGEITALHGRNGFLRARFEKGMPGQALGTEVNIE